MADRATIRVEGRRAYFDMLSTKECPYPVGPERSTWLEGYYTAGKEQKNFNTNIEGEYRVHNTVVAREEFVSGDNKWEKDINNKE